MRYIRVTQILVVGPLLALALLVAYVAILQSVLYQYGQTEARLDLLRGRYKVMSCGGDVASADIYRRILKERYAIERIQVASCVVNTAILGYADGYNGVSHPVIYKRFGEDVFHRIREEAEREYDLELNARSGDESALR